MLCSISIHIFLCLIKLAESIPTLSYPFNAQIPPVARVGQAYSYTLPANTFSNYRSDVVYTLVNAPAWIKLDTQTRQLSGTPGTANAGAPSFSIVAADSTGSAIDNVVLVVSSTAGPYIAESLQEQLRQIGTVDGNQGLVLPANTRFTIPFSKNTFAEVGNNITAFYGTSDNYTPLPSWIFFDPVNVVFTGTTPPVVSAIAPPQYFQFVLVGTEYPGFAGISASFQIVVGAHQLAFSTTQYVRTAAVGTQFSFQLPLATLLLDGTPIQVANISTSSANVTGTEFRYDTSSSILSGTPTAQRKTYVQITVIDNFGDAASVNVVIDSTGEGLSNIQLFTAVLPSTLNITQGQPFSLTFNSTYVATAASINVTVTNAPWLTYTAENRTLHGNAPITVQNTKRQTASPIIVITASSGSQSESRSINLSLIPSSTSTASSTLASTRQSSSTRSSSTMQETNASSTSALSTPTESGATISSSRKGLSQAQKLGIGLGIGLPVLLLLLTLLLCCCLSRRRHTTSHRSTSPSNISRPIAAEKEEWPQAAGKIYDEPRQLGAFQMFKSTSSDGRLSGYAMEVSDVLAPPLAPTTHTLPPLPDSPSLEAVRSAYGMSETEDTSSVHGTVDARPRALTQNSSVANIQPGNMPRMPLKSYHSGLMEQENRNRESAASIATVSTEELFSVRLVGDRNSASVNKAHLAPPLATRRQILSASETQNSGRTIGTYTSSEGEYIQRYGSQGESLSSGASGDQGMQQSRSDATQVAPWRVMNSQDSHGSFGSYATTDSSFSDDFSYDESSGSTGSNRRPLAQVIVEEPEEDEVAEIGQARQKPLTLLGPRTVSAVSSIQAPMSPDWNGSNRSPASLLRRPTLNERVLSTGKGKLMETPARQLIGQQTLTSNNTTPETSAEIAFV